MRNARVSIFVVLMLMAFGLSTARGSFFTMPVDGTLYAVAAGGDAEALSEFGTGTAAGNFHPLITGAPSAPSPTGEVEVGKFFAGTSVDFGLKTSYFGTFYAFSIDTVGSGARTTFMDLNNSLGLGGNVVELISTNLYRLRLDDAASFAYDDDDNDVLINLRVAPGVVPEPGMLAGVGSLALLMLRLRRVRA